MKHPEFKCSSCGSDNIRRSHSESFSEFPRMALGNYPFRCLECRNRFWVNIWLFSKGSQAVCPRCLAVEVLRTPTDAMRLGIIQRALVRFGARGYLCTICNRRFLSFKHEANAANRPVTRQDVQASNVETARAGVLE